MKKYPPIPTPWSLRWREFQVRILPILVFVTTTTVVAMLWSKHASARALVGQAEGNLVTVSSTLPGLLTQVRVERFKEVMAGAPVADVIIADPRLVESSLAVFRAEAELIRAGLDPLVNRERNRLNQEQLRLRLLEHKIDLADARVQLQYAESELARFSHLLSTSGTNAVSIQMYEIAVRDRDALKARIEAEEQLVTQMETGVQGYVTTDTTRPGSSSEEALRAAIKVQEELLAQTSAELSPITLYAPISGNVTMVYRRTGENIVAGEPLISIAGSPDRIVAYVPQTATFEARVGMNLRVRSRGYNRPSAMASILQVGTVVERMPTNLVLYLDPTGRSIELGTPVLVSLPQGIALRHGEIVDLEPTER